MLIWTLLRKGFFYYRRLELITSVHIRCWKCRLCAAVNSAGKITKSLCTCVVVADFFLVYTVLRREWSVVDWGLATRLAIFSLLTTRRKEIGKLWHCSKERIRNTHLRVEISILRYCFIVELFEKRRSPLPQSRVSLGRLIWAFLATQLGVSTCESAKSRRHMGGGGGGLGSPLACFPPNTRN
jgi:hypothetical protein